MECKNCSDKSKYRISGQAFTAYECKICEKEYMHHNTRAPSICPECSKDNAVCARCGVAVIE